MKAKQLLAALLLLINATAWAQSCPCMLPLDTSFHPVPFTNGTAPNYRNDDGSTIEITLPFTFHFYNQLYNSVYINNNGNISFGTSYPTFTGNDFPDATYSMVAPFWADVDTRNPNSGLVYYKMTPTALIVRWDNVGYFSSQADKKNDFQIIISDGSNADLPENYNVQFCYGDMQWTTGAASGGINGFAGTPATAGANFGNGTSFWQIGRFDQAGTDYDGPAINADGISYLDNKTFYANMNIDQDTLDPFALNVNVCDTVYTSVGFPKLFQFIIIPEFPGYTISASVDTTNISGFNYTVYAAPNNKFLTLNGTMLGNASHLGLNELVINASYVNPANHADSLSRQYKYYYYLQQCTVADTVAIVKTNDYLCAEGTVTLSTNNAYSEYYWLPSSTNTPTIDVILPGTYTVAVMDANGCSDTASVSFTQQAPILFDVAVDGTTLPSTISSLEFCSNFPPTSMSMSTKHENAVYSWSYNNTQGPEIVFSSLPYDTTFYLTMTVTDTVTQCTGTKVFLLSFSICGATHEQALGNIKLYPNPATDNLVWNAPVGTDIKGGMLLLYNAAGQLVYAKQPTGLVEILPVNNLPNGSYYLRTMLTTGTKTMPFVKIGE